MQYDIEVAGEARQVSVTRRGERFLVVVGERQWLVDATAAIGGHIMSLLVEPDTPGLATGAGAIHSREISVATDPVTGQFVFNIGTLAIQAGLNTRRRYGRKDDAAGTGPQRLLAPMPGKVVRILARTGDSVAHRQPVIVIEAMKMENELRASRDGTVTDVLVREGQSVDAGTLLAIITPA